jgi:hypothetical protein
MYEHEIVMPRVLAPDQYAELAKETTQSPELRRS